MARIRTIKPEFWTDEKVGRLKRDVRLLFIGLWNISDDQGVIKSNPAYIKGQLFSYDEELRVNTVQDWLTSLIQARMLIPFNYQNEGYYLVRTFEDHQLINRPSKPKFPEELLIEVKNTHGVCSEYSQPEGNGKEGKGTGNGGEAKTTPKNKKVIPHLFRESKIFNKEEFINALAETQYQAANVNYYHEIILNWSDSKHAVKADWLATAKNWMAKDMTEGKFITNTFKPPQNGAAKNRSQQSTGAGVSASSAFDKIDSMLSKT